MSTFRRYGGLNYSSNNNITRSYISNSLRILTLPEDVIKLIEAQKLSTGHAKILVGLDNASFVANKIIDNNPKATLNPLKKPRVI